MLNSSMGSSGHSVLGLCFSKANLGDFADHSAVSYDFQCCLLFPCMASNWNPPSYTKDKTEAHSQHLRAKQQAFKILPCFSVGPGTWVMLFLSLKQSSRIEKIMWISNIQVAVCIPRSLVVWNMIFYLAKEGRNYYPCFWIIISDLNNSTIFSQFLDFW